MSFLIRSLVAFVTFISIPGVAAAQTGPVVVELYTSQGCSSCPPADAMLTELSAMDGVIALALHVDYWDYIGWKDDFADPAYTQRQQGYARAAGAATIYTPQFVVGGTDIVVGPKAMKLTDSIRAQSQRPLPVAVTLTRDGTRVTISATAAETQPMVVQLVRTTDAATIDITRGENAGQQVTYSNIVESWDVLTQWDGADDLSLTAEVAAADQIVVIVQRGTHGAILGAAALN